MNINDADRFSWVAKHIFMFQVGMYGATIKYINNLGLEDEYYYNYYDNNIPDVGQVDEVELFRKIVDTVMEKEQPKTH